MINTLVSIIIYASGSIVLLRIFCPPKPTCCSINLLQTYYGLDIIDAELPTVRIFLYFPGKSLPCPLCGNWSELYGKLSSDCWKVHLRYYVHCTCTHIRSTWTSKVHILCWKFNGTQKCCKKYIKTLPGYAKRKLEVGSSVDIMQLQFKMKTLQSENYRDQGKSPGYKGWSNIVFSFFTDVCHAALSLLWRGVTCLHLRNVICGRFWCI